ncbi:MAG: hypothetical protein M1816_001986 [Peltula sp. TS41687]|nr:MAG: hypothetical protein M1816_001986 [Peltula sp. TS41687]
MANPDPSRWDTLEWKRRLETFGQDDRPILASGPQGQLDAICNLGELTDKGRETTLAFGKRLRHLYVDQLGFMPRDIQNADMIYLRATPIPRALESMQQTFWGMYPSSSRGVNFPPPTMLIRNPADETLYPNDGNCRRFNQLSRAFAQRTADRWNHTKEMDYLNTLISKWMPGGSRVAVDSHPRLSGIMDTINSTLAHGPATRLPKEFYDQKGREIIDRIGVEEWFSGYKESGEYRALGIGALLGDIVSRMVGSAEGNRFDGRIEVSSSDDNPSADTGIKFGLSGCHDITLAAVLASLGAFEGERWPPYTSHIALELFRRGDEPSSLPSLSATSSATSSGRPATSEPPQKTLWSSLFGRVFRGDGEKQSTEPGPAEAIARKPTSELKDEEKDRLKEHFVRIRYNDRPMVVEGCKATGKHLEGDESFCTLAAFKEIVDKFTPKNWKEACAWNLDKPAFPERVEPAGI